MNREFVVSYQRHGNMIRETATAATISGKCARSTGGGILDLNRLVSVRHFGTPLTRATRRIPVPTATASSDKCNKISFSEEVEFTLTEVEINRAPDSGAKMDVQRKRLNKVWKPLGFEDFGIHSRCKRLKLDGGAAAKGSDIAAACEPKTVEELATHPKKVEELKNWFQMRTASKSPMLLITGPAGSAKTVTLKVVVSSLNMSLREWINPVDKTDFKSGSLPLDKSEFTESRQCDKFEDFIFRSSRYKSLFEDGAESVVLVEDFPNIFLYDPKLFYEFLEKYREKGKSPIVFICTDDQNLNLSHDLFPNGIRTKYDITEIKFNPVNQSSMMRTLKRVASKCADKEVLAVGTLQTIAQSSNGDIRNALASLEILAGSSRPKRGTRTTRAKDKNQKSPSSSSELVSLKDSRTDFYQALGRVLYPKTITKMGRGEGNLENEQRMFVHDVTEISNSFSDSFLMLLHENYVDRFNDLDSIAAAANVFSVSDAFLGEAELREYAGLISVVGLMTNNKDPNREGFKPMKKSGAPSSITKDIWANCSEYSHLHATYKILILDILPYLKRLNSCKGFKDEGSTLKTDETNFVIEEFDED